MNQKRFLIFAIILPLFGQEVDSLSRKTPQEAMKRALMFPGGGQFYNGETIKGALLVVITIGSAYFYADNANNYDNYSGTDSAIKQDYLEQRNKYGWWIGFVYIYGLLDAIVEAHLHPFKEVMNEDLEQPIKEGNQEK